MPTFYHFKRCKKGYKYFLSCTMNFAFKLIEYVFSLSFRREQILARCAMFHSPKSLKSQVPIARRFPPLLIQTNGPGCLIWPLSTTTFPFSDVRMIEYYLFRINCENCTRFIIIYHLTSKILCSQLGLGLVKGRRYGKSKSPAPTYILQSQSDLSSKMHYDDYICILHSIVRNQTPIGSYSLAIKLLSSFLNISINGKNKAPIS